MREKSLMRLLVINKPAYKCIVKSGGSHKTSIFRLCNRMIRDETFPKKFSETMLKQMWKNKGRRELSDNQRFIHLKDWKPRLTETLVTRMMNPEILKTGTKYQIGGVPRHRI